jgi:type VI secretion system FHA domain protein
MLLALSIISEQGAALGPTAYKVFDERGGSIGRVAGNDWVLPDPQNFVSSRHARVHARGGVFYLEDTSSNGTFINAPDRAASRTEPVPLNDGDRLYIGDYEIIVQLIPGAPAEAAARGQGAGAVHASAHAPTQINAVPGVMPPVPPMPAVPQPMPAMPPPVPAEPPGLGLGTVDPLAALGGARSQPRRQAFQPPPAASTPSAAHVPMPGHGVQGSAGSASNSPLSGAPASGQAALGQGASGHAGSAQAASAQAAQAAPASPAPGSAADLLVALGLDPTRVDAAIQQQLGQILRLTVHGLVEVLKSRAEVKNSFRLPTTSIKPVENNPLKFSMNAEDAIYNLFVKRNPGYLGPVESFEEGFDDVNHHQAAVLAGIRAGFNAMLAKFHPTHLEEVYERKLRRTAMLGLGSKLKFWEMYRTQFEEIDRDREASFQLLFGEEFARAYNEHLQKLAAAARLRKPR